LVQEAIGRDYRAVAPHHLVPLPEAEIVVGPAEEVAAVSIDDGFGRGGVDGVPADSAVVDLAAVGRRVAEGVRRRQDCLLG